MNAKWQHLLAEVSLKPSSYKEADKNVDLFVSPLSCHGVISLHGEQSESYLQGQLSNDITSLQENDYLMNAHCDAKGKWDRRRDDNGFHVSNHVGDTLHEGRDVGFTGTAQQPHTWPYRVAEYDPSDSADR